MTGRLTRAARELARLLLIVPPVLAFAAPGGPGPRSVRFAASDPRARFGLDALRTESASPAAPPRAAAPPPPPVPADDELPALASVVDAAHVRRWVDERREAIGLPAAAIVQRVDVERVRYRPAEHCLLRYRVHASAPGAAPAPPVVVYAKAYARGRGAYVYRVLREIHDHPGRAPGVGVPRPLAYIPEAGAVWTAEWPGTRLAGGVGDPGLEPGPSRAMVEIAHLLAGLHTLRGVRVRLQPARSASRALDDARRDAAGIARFHPAVTRRLDEFVERLARTVPPPRRAPRAVLHGGFRISQLLRAPDGRLGLVDFDRASRGDPHHDLADFLSSYRFRTLMRHWSALSARDGAEQFVEAYQLEVPWRCDAPRLDWYTAAFTLGRVHASIKSLEWTERGQIERAMDLISEYTHGGRR